MCGIVGLWNPGANSEQMTAVFEKMCQTQVHRGPEAQGTWNDPSQGVWLGHQRLAFMDLSPAGAQPMISANGRFVLTYNGEIYNTHELKQALQEAEIPLRGYSDTEMLLEICALWGVEKALSYLNGMFAFALYDRETHTLTLARDRLGIKPLYWSYQHNIFLFSSELKALKAFDPSHLTIDTDVIPLFLNRGYIPAPHTIYKHVYKLEPGTVLTFKAGQITQHAYWSLNTVAAQPKLKGVLEDHLSDLHMLLKDAVNRCLLADVPVGALLSGGIDSSLVTALAQTQTAQPLHTFTIGSHDPLYDESQEAQQIAQHLGTTHHAITITSHEAQQALPRLPQLFDEPFADPSALPTYLVSHLARQTVKTVLSGDGGDELLAGYKRYTFINQWIKRRQHLPLASILGWGMQCLSPETWDSFQRFLPSSMRALNMGKRLHVLADMLQKKPFTHIYENFTSNGSTTQWLQSASIPASLTTIEKMQFIDMRYYLPDDLLVKVDRTSMAVSLETRVPLLDHRLVEMLWSFPENWKINGQHTKNAFRKILAHYLPPRLFERPKKGFSVPLATWLQQDLSPWANDLLDSTIIKDFCDHTRAQRLWQQHLKGHANHQAQLWPLLVLAQWHKSLT